MKSCCPSVCVCGVAEGPLQVRRGSEGGRTSWPAKADLPSAPSAPSILYLIDHVWIQMDAHYLLIIKNKKIKK